MLGGTIRFLVVCLLPALVQATVLSGVVVDPSGAPIANARVDLLSASQSVVRSVRSAADGTFSVTDVPPGQEWLVLVTAASFSPQRVRIETSRVLSIRMSVADLKQVLTVSAESSRVREVADVPQQVVLRSRDDLERDGLLAEDTGVSPQSTGTWMRGVSVRGLLGKNVAVFRDGVRYTTSAQRGGVSTFFNLLEPSALDAVEILRGPNSAQYGSDSLGGTVQFLSRTPSYDGFHGEFAPTYNTADHSFGTNLLASYGHGRWSSLVNLAARRVNTLRPGQGIDTHAAVTRFLGLPSTILGDYRLPDTAYTQYSGSLRAQYALTPERQLIFHYERAQQDGAKRYDQLLGGDGNLVADVRNIMLDFGYIRFLSFRTGLLDELAGTLSYNAQREERVNQGGQGNPLGEISHQYERTRVWGFSGHATKRAGEHYFLIGGDGYREGVRAPAFSYFPQTGEIRDARPRIPDGAVYSLYGIYGQHTWQLRDVTISSAIRYGGATFNSTAGSSVSSVTGRAGAVWRVAGPLRLHGQYSRGFRAPSLTDLGTLGLQGNGFYEAAARELAGYGGTIGTRADEAAVSSGRAVSALVPETTDNYEGGVQFGNGRVRTDITAFRMDLADAIVSQTLILPAGAFGLPLGDQVIVRQLASGAVFVPAATAPVQVRGNSPGTTRITGVEHWAEAKLSSRWSIRQTLTWIRARDRQSGAPPDIEGGTPPLTGTTQLRYVSRHGHWVQAQATLAGRQDRLSSLALADRRTGAARSRAAIANFFNRGARVRGLVSPDGRLIATGETLAQVQQRVLGTADSAPMFTAVPGYAVFAVHAGLSVTERSSVLLAATNLMDKSHRAVSWGVDGPGRSVSLGWRYRF